MVDNKFTPVPTLAVGSLPLAVTLWWYYNLENLFRH